MGTITKRRRSDGTIGFTAQIRINRDGRKYTEAQTFDRRPSAVAWLKKRETELAGPDALALANQTDPLLRQVIDRYITEIAKTMGRTKAHGLKTIKTYDIANLKCSRIGSEQISQFASELASVGLQPSTVQGYISTLRAVFVVAKPLWGYPLDIAAMNDAGVALRQMGTIGKSKYRDRRPTLAELDKLLTHFVEVQRRRQTANDMVRVICFAIYSTRRQDEIARLAWDDLDADGSRILVRDMKDPHQKDGNDIWCDLTPEALRIIQATPRHHSGRIFPYTAPAISAAFFRATAFLGIDDLTFHDLRHEGISRLFEMGRNIPQVACVSGHRSWSSLQRYTHIRQRGDKYEGWRWLDVVTRD
jgi:integrase